MIIQSLAIVTTVNVLIDNKDNKKDKTCRHFMIELLFSKAIKLFIFAIMAKPIYIVIFYTIVCSSAQT
jgi:hypothetical protein